ncbi:MAG: MBL fold metallo-hydrolase [Saprospiraceae bacterium]|jgi:glyoxylase-like metal-dependent hydrolase (beta-lactamase superfamily II)|nr:MBL fold metallo-hydrolase [Candidatus Vicinibacter proximus]MCC6841840.1 MBL fold metallo-hydrolase [Saprospiraceae bacterium]HRG32884.1 MBL fold metallo-hydrolase [Saprospiraceae bacterium]
MAQNATVSIQLFASGYCEAHAYVVNPLEGKRKTSFYAVWALIHIPHIGYVLFDTGYSEAFQLATKYFPERFYRWATPIQLESSETAKSIIESQNIQIKEIKYIIISHFHADHIAGLKDFPDAKFICSKSAYEQVMNLHGIKAVSKGILHKLIPDNFNLRVQFIEDFADVVSINEFGMTVFELFGINEYKLVLLPGHAKGMLGFIYIKENESILYATDASWSYDTYSRGILPMQIVKLFFDSWSDFVETQQKIRAFELSNQHCTILFTHCKQTLALIANVL